MESQDKKVILLYYPLIEKGEVFTNIPWAMLYLERMVRDLDVEVIILDERFEKNPDRQIKKYIDRILFTAVSVMIGHQITGAVKYTEVFRKLSDRPVMWGGWFPTVVPEIILKDRIADYVCLGQGEMPFRLFTEKMLAGEFPSGIEGIGYIKEGKPEYIYNNIFTDPDTFPEPDFDKVDINALIDVNGKMPEGERSVDYLATSGCPYSCRFCNAVHLFKRKWHPKKPDRIIQDIKYLIAKANVSHINFRDDNFFGNRKFILTFCKLLIESNINITWESNVHLGFLVRNLSDEDIDLIYRSGCRMLRIGAESGDQEALNLINKEISVDEIYKVVRMLKGHKIKTRFLTMSCFPLNPHKDFWKTVKLIGRVLIINPDVDPRLRFYVPVPKTDLYDLSVKKGFILPDTTQKMMEFFSECFTYHYVAPWNNEKYLRYLNYYNKFYFLWVVPYFYKKFPLKLRSLAFILNMFLYLFLLFRFKTGLLKFPLEARLFMWFTKYAVV